MRAFLRIKRNERTSYANPFSHNHRCDSNSGRLQQLHDHSPHTQRHYIGEHPRELVGRARVRHWESRETGEVHQDTRARREKRLSIWREAGIS